ncbi:exo-alpha-sialidase [Candidatus Bathyarchaeota archaeon]|nr:exo-alpha-sialidase [Candidatus Bathyarchaeota archaeon]
MTSDSRPVFTTVFRERKDGYHTYRIPSIVAARDGSLVALAEGRRSRKDQSGNDIVMKRSSDNGDTWQDFTTIASMGDDSLNNPQAVVLRDSGDIILFYQLFPYPSYVRALVPGFVDPPGKRLALPWFKRIPKRVTRAFCMRSKDNGSTWSTPQDITAQVKRPSKVTSLSGGPGVGIELRREPFRNRIIMPFNQGPVRRWKVYAVYSDDGGKTWKYGRVAPPHPTGMKGTANEVQMVELVDGRIMLNARVQGGNHHRVVAYSSDGGETWTPLQEDPVLIEPQCQASIIRYSDPIDGQESRLLFSNPASKSRRMKGTIRMSYDEGKTWPVKRILCAGWFAYSCLAVLSDGTIGCLFEHGKKDAYETITFARFTLKWLTRTSADRIVD